MKLPSFLKPISIHNSVGLLLACLITAGMGWRFVTSSHDDLLRQHAERGAIMQAMAVADMVAQVTHPDAPVDAVEAIVTILDEWSLTHFEVDMMRVVRLKGARMLASTRLEDSATKELPRRLQKDEKWMFDLGHELRAAVETNREEGVNRKREIEITYLRDGLVRISAPYMHDFDVKGFVQIEAFLSIPGQDKSLLPAIMLAFAPALIFLILTQTPLFKRKEVAAASTKFVWKPLLVAIILLATGFSIFSKLTLEEYGLKRAQNERLLGGDLLSQREETKGILGLFDIESTYKGNRAFGLARLYIRTPELDPENEAHSIANTHGEVDIDTIAALEQEETGILREWLMGAASLGLITMLFFGFGNAMRTWITLVAHRSAYLYISPAIISMILLVFIPFGYGITMSFTDANIFNTGKSPLDIWIGLENYKSILGDFNVISWTDEGIEINYSSFYWTLYITVCWTIFNVIVGVSFGLILALALNTSDLAFRPIYRVLLILPWAMPNYITALIWKGMFHQQFGVINQLIQAIGMEPVAWFDTVFTSFMTGLVTNGWLSFPFMMVVCLGALQSIDQSMYEAARVEGASRWQQFRYVTMPSLKPTLVPAIILSVVWTFNMFNVIYLVSGGEPGGSNEILVTEAFKIAFEKYRYGYAAAYSVVIFIILLAYGVFQNKMSKASEGI
jgi:arabinogalactan oligomer/maltooligosaccharide transport system permease protein